MLRIAIRARLILAAIGGGGQQIIMRGAIKRVALQLHFAPSDVTKGFEMTVQLDVCFTAQRTDSLVPLLQEVLGRTHRLLFLI